MFVVIFEVHPHTTQVQQYLEYGKLLRPELEQIDGFIDNERFSSEVTGGRVLSLSTWRDEKALIRWRTHAQHHRVQEQGRTLVFADYRLRVGEVTTDSAPPDGHEVRQQRFDATESSATKALSVSEIMPSKSPADHDQLLRAATIDPDHAPAGWVESETFASIYQPGKRAILHGWRSEEAAQRWHAEVIAPLASQGLRSRLVRVIRAYGMHNRLEAPQYYPAVSADAAIW